MDSKIIGGIRLPGQVPYLNSREDFFVGNGIVGAGGSGDGTWNFLVGPDYTCPKYLKKEQIKLAIDGTEQSVTMDVHRARNTGIFYGVKTIGDLEVYLIDYAVGGYSWIARQVIVDNKSATADHTVGIKAYVNPETGDERSAAIIKDSSVRESAVALKLGTLLNCVMKFCPNWKSRYCLICFNEPTATVTHSADTYILETATQTIAPGGSRSVELCHYHADGEHADSSYIDLIRQGNIAANIESCIVQWQRWFDQVDDGYSLSPDFPNELHSKCWLDIIEPA